MKRGKKFEYNEKIPTGTWTITYWENGRHHISDEKDYASSNTYELLDFKPPQKPLVPEVGKWYLVSTKTYGDKHFRQCAMIDNKSCMIDLDGNRHGDIDDYEFLEEWAKVEK